MPHPPGSRIGAAAIILDEDRRVLLVKHKYGRRNWELPGGYVEPGESTTDAVVREVREETGLRVVPLRLTGIYYEADTDMHQFAFLGSSEEEGCPHPVDPEIEACGFFAIDKLPRPIHDLVTRRISDALAGRDLGMPETVPPRTWLEQERPDTKAGV
jgi:8-oxo-dGTP diphosphatase